MPLGPDDGEETWYVSYALDTPKFTRFESMDTAEMLREIWEAQGLGELAPLAGAIGELAAHLEEPTPTEDSDISPFVYVMF